jgi:hypothetical protein
MGRRIVTVFAALVTAGALLGATAAESQAYVGLKGGVFMPNDDEEGLKGLDDGFGGEFFFGGDVGPVSLEFGAGYARAKNGDADEAFHVASGLGTAKLYLPLGPIALYGGGGLGVYYARFGDDSDAPDGTGVGVHAVGGAEFSLGVVSLLAELKWNQAKVKVKDFGDTKMNVGGLMLNFGVIF